MGMTPDGTTNTAARTCHVDATGTRTTIPSLATTTGTNATRTSRRMTFAKETTMDTTVTEENNLYGTMVVTPYVPPASKPKKPLDSGRATVHQALAVIRRKLAHVRDVQQCTCKHFGSLKRAGKPKILLRFLRHSGPTGIQNTLSLWAWSCKNLPCTEILRSGLLNCCCKRMT